MAHWRSTHWTLALAVLGLCCVVAGVSVGSAGWELAWMVGDDRLAQRIVWDIRLPRTLGAWGVGALLGLAGALAQGLFRNPLADPFLLGSASGAALGIALALALTGHWLLGGGWAALGLGGAAFFGALLGVALTLLLARGVQHTLRLLLAGVIVGVVLGACKDLLLQTQPAHLPAMQSFLLGSTAHIGWEGCLWALASWLLCMALARVLAGVLDALALGELTAQSLGLALERWRWTLVAVLALATGTAVAQAGLIAFVGLAAPHLVRSLLRVRHAALVWLSSLMGGIVLVVSDLLARALVAPVELPVGVLTALLGGSYLLWLMHRAKGSLA